jgi:hypothetical protein
MGGTAAQPASARAPRGGSLRGRFPGVFIAIFVIGAAASYGAVAWFSRDVVHTLSGWFAEKSALYGKAKVLQPLLPREIALVQKMAHSPALKAWAADERNAAAHARAADDALYSAKHGGRNRVVMAAGE